MTRALELLEEGADRADSVVRNWAKGDLAQAVRELEEWKGAARDFLSDHPAAGSKPVARKRAALICSTARANYWSTPNGYQATAPDVGTAPPESAGGYARLDSLMKLKGQRADTIAKYCDTAGLWKGEGA